MEFLRRTARGLNTGATRDLSRITLESHPHLGKPVDLGVAEGALANAFELRSPERQQYARDFARAGDLHSMATSEDLQANPIAPRNFDELTRMINSRNYNNMGGAYAVLPPNANPSRVAERLQPVLDAQGMELGRYGIGKGGQPYVAWKNGMSGGGGGENAQGVSIFPREQRADGMLSDRFVQAGGLAPEVEMSGWTDKVNSPSGQPGYYPVLGKNNYVKPIGMNQSFSDIENEIQYAKRMQPESVMLSRQGEMLSAQDLLNQDTPQISDLVKDPTTGRDIPRTWMQSDDEQYQTPFFEKPSEQQFAVGDLTDIHWQTPRSVIAENSNQSLSSAPMRQVAYVPQYAPNNPQGNLGARTVTDSQGRIRNAYRVAPMDVVAELDALGLAKPAYERDVTNDVLFRENSVPPAFQAPDPMPSRGGYDVTSLPEAMQYEPDRWNKDVKVQLPSSVVADTRLSPYSLTLGSTVDAGRAGLKRTLSPWEDSEAIDRDSLNGYVQTRNRKGGIEYLEPGTDAQDVVDRIARAQRQAQTVYSVEKGRTAQAQYGNVPAQRVSAAAVVSNALNDPGISPELRSRLEGAQQRMGNLTGVRELATLQNNRDVLGERVAFSNNAISNAYDQLGSLPQTERTRITTIMPNGERVVENADLTFEQRLNEARDLQQRGYGQAATQLPSATNAQGLQMAQTQVGTDNLNTLLTYDNTKKFPQSNGTNLVQRNGALVQEYPLSDRQTAQYQSEVTAGLRKNMPTGTTQPGISMANEFLERGVPMGQAQQLPIQLGRFDADSGQGQGYLDYARIQNRFAPDEAELRNSAGIRLRGERPAPERREPASDAKRQIAVEMLKSRYPDTWQNYVV